MNLTKSLKKMPKKLIENRGDELLKQIPQKRFGKIYEYNRIRKTEPRSTR